MITFDELIGGKYLMSGTVEYNYQFAEHWRADLFVDSGTATNDFVIPAGFSGVCDFLVIAGGGGAGRNGTGTATAGTDGLGGGGGGQGGYVGHAAGAGGSGIVVIRYAV